jgi:exodeoxyribonuclease VIII
MNHVMLDLETWATSSVAAIVAIGAARFSSAGVGDQFYKVVSLQSSLLIGLEFDAGTNDWWMSRSVEAQAEQHKPCVPIRDALHDFCEWVGDDATVWGNGSDFDNSIIASAYQRSGIQRPWGNYQGRCYRTIKNLCPEIEIERRGTHHVAVDDAASQAIHLIRCADHLGITDVLFPTTKEVSN